MHLLELIFLCKNQNSACSIFLSTSSQKSGPSEVFPNNMLLIFLKILQITFQLVFVLSNSIVIFSFLCSFTLYLVTSLLSSFRSSILTTVSSLVSSFVSSDSSSDSSTISSSVSTILLSSSLFLFLSPHPSPVHLFLHLRLCSSSFLQLFSSLQLFHLLKRLQLAR